MDEQKERELSTRDIAGVERDEKTYAIKMGPAGPAVMERPERAAERPEGVEQRPEGEERAEPLFANETAHGYRTRWDAIQTGFVDEPRRAVEQADALVADVMQRLAEGFANERSALERLTDRADQISTEDLRVALRRYRSFFQRLLSI